MRATGSASGLYSAAVFRSWEKQGWVPFDPSDKAECDARLVLPRIGRVKSRFFAFVSYDERWTDEMAESAVAPALTAGAPVSISLVHGDHKEMLKAALLRFREEIDSSP